MQLTPTNELRFVRRFMPVPGRSYAEEKDVLQQKWVVEFYEEWRDIPVVEEGATAVLHVPVTDLLRRLRELAALEGGDPAPDWLPPDQRAAPLGKLAADAADEIERLRKIVDGLPMSYWEHN